MKPLYNSIGDPYVIDNLVMRKLTSVQNYIDIYIIEDAKSKYQMYKDIDKEDCIDQLKPLSIPGIYLLTNKKKTNIYVGLGDDRNSGDAVLERAFEHVKVPDRYFDKWDDMFICVPKHGCGLEWCGDDIRYLEYLIEMSLRNQKQQTNSDTVILNSPGHTKANKPRLENRKYTDYANWFNLIKQHLSTLGIGLDKLLGNVDQIIGVDNLELEQIQQNIIDEYKANNKDSNTEIDEKTLEKKVRAEITRRFLNSGNEFILKKRDGKPDIPANMINEMFKQFGYEFNQDGTLKSVAEHPLVKITESTRFLDITSKGEFLNLICDRLYEIEKKQYEGTSKASFMLDNKQTGKVGKLRDNIRNNQLYGMSLTTTYSIYQRWQLWEDKSGKQLATAGSKNIKAVELSGQASKDEKDIYINDIRNLGSLSNRWATPQDDKIKELLFDREIRNGTSFDPDQDDINSIKNDIYADWLASIKSSNKPLDYNKRVVVVQEYFEREFSGMTFDIVVGNPPYQDKNDNPLYQYFMDVAMMLATKGVTMITKNTWLTRYKNDMEGLRRRVINYGLKYIRNFDKTNQVFEGAGVAVCYFNLIKGYTGKTRYELDSGDDTGSEKESYEEKLLPDDIIYKSKEAAEAAEIRKREDFRPYDKVMSQSTFKLGPTLSIWCNKSNGIINSSNEPTDKFSIAIATLPDKSFKFKYTSLNELKSIKTRKDKLSLTEDQLEKLSTDIIPGYEYINKYKVICGHILHTSKNVITNIHILKPGQIYCESFAALAIVDTYEEALKIEKYIKTKFFRYLVSLALSDGTNTAGNNFFRFVPAIETINDSKVDWNASIEEINQKLCVDEYKLSKDCIDSIDKNIDSI